MPKTPIEHMHHLTDYLDSRAIAAQAPTFYSLLMAAMRRADTNNQALLREAFPSVWDELQARYNAPGGALTPHEIAWLHRAPTLVQAEEGDY